MVDTIEVPTLTRDDQKKDAHPGWGYVSPTMILDSDAALPLQITSLGSMDGAAVGMRVGSILTGASVGKCEGSGFG
jgi:hypothetical protein